MGCQTAIAEQIIEQGGDDVLSLKGNQETLASEVEEAFIHADAREYEGVDKEVLETVERGHSRLETRRYRTLGDLSGVPRSTLWEGMNMIGLVDTRREIDGQVSIDIRCFIGSTGISATRFADAVLRHLALSRLKNDDTKVGLKNKRLRAACNEDYLAKLLFEWPENKEKTGVSGKPNIRKAICDCPDSLIP
ncbi:transposase [Thiocapsa marina 5811]|uniref:Transposase n=2 Tax=Thiocapsa marina TaxID=244573 RepID=F9U6T1_9GAMM|nr:transposase [Thiocapsa marina 5811]